VEVTFRAGGHGQSALARIAAADMLLGQNGNDTLARLAGIDLLCRWSSLSTGWGSRSAPTSPTAGSTAESRWPPGAANTIALVAPSEGASADGDVARCALATADIEADHATLRARGVDVDAKIARTGTPTSGLVSNAVSVEDPVPAQFFVRDPDGNRFLIVQPD